MIDKLIIGINCE